MIRSTCLMCIALAGCAGVNEHRADASLADLPLIESPRIIGVTQVPFVPPGVASGYDDEARGDSRYVFCNQCPERTQKALDVPPRFVSAPPVAMPIAAATPSPAHLAFNPIHVMFGLASSHIGPRQFLRLRRAISRTDAQTVFLIEGHTDLLGKRAFNARLAARRARAVRSALLKIGVSPKKITSVSSRCCVEHPPRINPNARRADVVIITGESNGYP